MRNIISGICSTLVFILILTLIGIFGPAVAAAGFIVLKILLGLIVYAFVVRVPIELMNRNDRALIEKKRQALHEEAVISLREVADRVQKSNVKFNSPGADHPIAPMPPEED